MPTSSIANDITGGPGHGSLLSAARYGGGCGAVNNGPSSGNNGLSGNAAARVSSASSSRHPISHSHSSHLASGLRQQHVLPSGMGGAGGGNGNNSSSPQKLSAPGPPPVHHLPRERVASAKGRRSQSGRSSAMAPAAPVQHGSTSGAEASSFAAQQLPGAIMQQHAHAHAMSVKMGGNFAMHSQSGPPSLDFTVKGKQTSTGYYCTVVC